MKMKDGAIIPAVGIGKIALNSTREELLKVLKGEI